MKAENSVRTVKALQFLAWRVWNQSQAISGCPQWWWAAWQQRVQCKARVLCVQGCRQATVQHGHRPSTTASSHSGFATDILIQKKKKKAAVSSEIFHWYQFSTSPTVSYRAPCWFRKLGSSLCLSCSRSSGFHWFCGWGLWAIRSNQALPRTKNKWVSQNTNIIPHRARESHP